MKYLWTWGYIYGLWLGCKPPLNIYPSVITSLYGHKMEVSVVILLRPAGPDLWSLVSDVWEDWCHIMVTSSWLMPTVASQLGWAGPSESWFQSEWNAALCNMSRVTNKWAQSVTEKRWELTPFIMGVCSTIWRCLSIFHWNLSRVVQIYTGSGSELISWLDLDNLDSHHYPSDYKLSPLSLTPSLKAVSLQTRNFQTQYCEPAPI